MHVAFFQVENIENFVSSFKDLKSEAPVIIVPLTAANVIILLCFEEFISSLLVSLFQAMGGASRPRQYSVYCRTASQRHSIAEAIMSMLNRFYAMCQANNAVSMPGSRARLPEVPGAFFCRKSIEHGR